MSQPNLLPTSVKPYHYDLLLKPNLNVGAFDGEVNISLDVLKDTQEISFNYKELDIKQAEVIILDSNRSVQVTGIESDSKAQVCKVILEKTIKIGEKVKLNLIYTGTLNRKMAGFYLSSYNDEEDKECLMASTHFEPSDARQAFPCWDEPALRATFKIKLQVLNPLMALANTPIISKEEVIVDGKSHSLYDFEITPNMSTYLIAFAVGNFDYIEGYTKHEKIKTRVYAIKGSAKQGEFALKVACDVMDLYHELFSIPYPISKLDLIAIPDFNIGAMENWGLVTFRTVCLLYDETSSFDRKLKVANIVCHELAHQWFGNLVALKWWSQLWLKEGFATFIASYAVNKLFPNWKVWSNFVQDDYQRALILDSLKSSHPIEVVVNDPKEIGQIFDAISYSKGASILRMLCFYLGEKFFFEGVKYYLNKYQYSNASTEDLWLSLEHTSGIDVKNFMKCWTTFTGYPILKVISKEDKVSVRQTRFFANSKTQAQEELNWWVPLLIKDNSQVKVLSEKEITIDNNNNNKYFKLNSDSIGVYRVLYNESNLKLISDEIEFGTTLSDDDKIGLLSNNLYLSISNNQSIVQFLNLLTRFKNEKSPLVMQEVSNCLIKLSSIFYDSENINKGLNKLSFDLFKSWADKLGLTLVENEDPLVSNLRPTCVSNMCKSGDKDYIQQILNQYHAFVKGMVDDIPKDLIPLILKIAVKQDASNYNQVKQIFEHGATTDLKLRALAALGNVQDDALIRDGLNYLLSDNVRAQDSLTLLSALAINSKARKIVWNFVKQQWSTLEQRYSHNVSTLGNILKATAALLSEEEDVNDVIDFFNDKDTKAYNMALKNSLEIMQTNSMFKKEQSKALGQWFDKLV